MHEHDEIAPGFTHEHAMGESEHTHAFQGLAMSEPIDMPVEESHESTEDVAEAALDAIVEMHAQEEETERIEAITDALEAVAEAQADVIEDGNETVEAVVEAEPPDPVEDPLMSEGVETVEPPEPDESSQMGSSEETSEETAAKRRKFKFQR